MEAFGVEWEEVDESLSLSDPIEPAGLLSFIPAESGASSKVS